MVDGFQDLIFYNINWFSIMIVEIWFLIMIVESPLFGMTGLNNGENAWIIESTMEYVRTTERFITSLFWIHLSKSPLFLKFLINSGSPYVILFSCLVAQFFIYVYIIFNALLSLYHQGYVVCNLFFWIFFFSSLCISYS